MSKNSQSGGETPFAFFEAMTKASIDAFEANARTLNDLSQKMGQTGQLEEMQKAFAELAVDFAKHPEKIAEHQLELVQQQGQLWADSVKRFMTGNAENVQVARGDKRFSDKSWHESEAFEFLQSSYLLACDWARKVIDDVDAEDEHERRKIKFYAEQIANAMSPSNFVFTNPEIIKLTLESGGENLVKGLEQFEKDMKSGSISQADYSAFEVGRNMAMTPGKVVWQNGLIQLIQYAPTTKKVYKKPLLIVPPWINKFYILDLNEKKSFVRWAVEQGLTVFIISWVNPQEKHRHKSFEDYMREGILESLDVIENATGETQVNAIGYCVGGTLLASTLAYMAAKKDKRITSATFFTTQVDFVDAGDLLCFVDEVQVSAIEASMTKTGFMPGSTMATAFSMLRSNDLIWSYVVNNYLKGRKPMAFDLLSWNADSTNLTEANHSFYLRQCYLNNNLSRGKMKLGGETIDLGKITIPLYNLAAREDHIAPLKSVFKLKSFVSSDVRTVVSGSGHIAGVINPPSAGKYQFWSNDDKTDDLKAWMKGAQETPGSWWPDWFSWVSKKSGAKVAARKPGGGKLELIEDAPGSYVKVKAS